MTDRAYAIHSDEECERLEAQARLAHISSHLKYLPLKPGMSVLDAGCGSGSMTRQIAAADSALLWWASTCENRISILLVERLHQKI